MANPSSVKKIMDNWILRSKTESEPFNKFISLWIAFNGYYVSATGENRDAEALKKIKSNNELKNWYDTIKNHSSVTTLISIAPVKNLKSGNDVTIDRDDFGTVIDIVYQIRNNLFHGNKSDHVNRDNEVVSAAIPILEQITVYCQQNFLTLDF